jgi:Ankyrin repeats (3 copies)
VPAQRRWHTSAHPGAGAIVLQARLHLSGPNIAVDPFRSANVDARLIAPGRVPGALNNRLPRFSDALRLRLQLEIREATVLRLRSDDSLASTLHAAIPTGDLASLKQLINEHPALVSAIVGEAGNSRTPLHFATDWPSHFPNGAAVVAALIDAGADPNIRCEGARYAETPLHWVASTDDIKVFEVLIRAGADIEAPGGSIGDGTPLDNAAGYGQWQVARRLVECGARTKLWHLAALD